jgi:hypothetical protein
MISRWWRFVWIILLFLLGISTFAGSRLVDAEIISLPLLTISIVTGLYLLSLALIHIAPDRNSQLSSPEILDASIFLLLATTAVIGRIATSGVNDWYYPLIIGTTMLLTFRIVSRPTRTHVHLTQILLLAIIARAIPWFSYLVYGQDRFHQTAVGHIVTSGIIVPESISYYANFPAAHVFAATYTIVTGTELKIGYFSLGIIVAVSLIGVYLLARSVLADKQSALLATLFVSVAGYHVKAGAEPFAQALFTALVPFILYLLFHRDRSERELYVLMLLVVFASTIQNIAPLILLGICALVVGSELILNHVPVLRRARNPDHNYTIPLVIPALVGVVGIYYYVIADYFRFQTMRIVWLLEPLFGTADPEGQSAIENTGVSGIPTVELFGYTLPDVLMWAAPVLTVAGILILGTYHVVDEILAGNPDLQSLQYVLLASTVYAVFALAFVSGGPATRALPSIIVLTAPVVGWVVLQYSNDNIVSGKSVAVILILCVVSAGVLTPPVAKAELSENNFRAWMNSEETAAVEFSMAYSDEVYSSSYFAGYESYLRGMKGVSEERTIQGNLTRNNPESTENYEYLSQDRETVIYSAYYRSAYSVEAPTTNIVYSTGDVEIYT